ncbi:MAG: hypothetical protein RIK87_11605 [Fuerstiella sp.]
MKFQVAIAAAIAATLLVPGRGGAEEPKKDSKTTAVTIKDLVLHVPEDWKLAKNTSSMRLATYTVPAAKGDPEDGELAISSFGGDGGGIAPNLSRWVGQFSGDGRTAKIVKGSAGENDYYVADIAGTYNKPDGPPFLRKTKPTPGYRMIGMILILKGKGVYFLKLTGPDKTVAAQRKAIRTAIGGDIEAEQDYEL